MTLIEKLHGSILMLDGGMGTSLQSMGLLLGELPETWNLTHPDAIKAIHRAYLDAGADVIYANTFGANTLKFGSDTAAIVARGVALAKEAASDYENRFVALDIGPTGKLLAPLGDLDFEDAVSVFAETVKAGAAAGADLIVIETMNDTYELKAAMLAAKENADLPIFVTCVFGADAKMMTGATPEAAAALAESLGATAVGLNCSLAPAQMTEAVSRLIKSTTLPVIVKPNAGIPREENGKTVYDLSPAAFARDMEALLSLGVHIVGGCCGTTPAYIAELSRVARTFDAPKPKATPRTVISSYTHTVTFDGAPVLIGERINPTGKKRLKEALRANDISYLLGEAIAQVERGVDVLDVNVGLPEIDEPSLLCHAVCEIQGVCDLPLQIDTADPVAMERALRRYNGKPLVNSVSGKQEVMDAIFPLVKKYGGVVIALTLDESGIPETAEGRVEIARRIVNEAEKYGIGTHDIIFDTLAMAVSADANAPKATLDALDTIRNEMGIHTSLGISNVSFGLPMRDYINSTFFAMALARGLSAAIMNPNSEDMMRTYKTYCALKGYDDGCLSYIEYAQSLPTQNVQTAQVLTPTQKMENTADRTTLRYQIEHGLGKEAQKIATELVKAADPIEVINGEIIPALDTVGKAFEEKRLFLPQLLMSAEAASRAFDGIKTAFGAGGAPLSKKTVIVVATVKGDIHDIGKNIVCTLLENYGFTVHDLGRDVAPEAVLEAAKALGAHIVGLSALMTTTVAAMAETVALLHAELPECKILVGGAVMTEEYARQIGADKYAKDAMEGVRYAEEIETTL